MPQSSTLYVGMDIHKDAIAVASVVQDHGAEVVSLGNIGTRQCDIDTRIRRLQAVDRPCLVVATASPMESVIARHQRSRAFRPVLSLLEGVSKVAVAGSLHDRLCGEQGNAGG